MTVTKPAALAIITYLLRSSYAQGRLTSNLTDLVPKTKVHSKWLGHSLLLSPGIYQVCCVVFHSLECRVGSDTINRVGGVLHSCGSFSSAGLCPQYLHLLILISSVTSGCQVSALIWAFVTLSVQRTARILHSQLFSKLSCLFSAFFERLQDLHPYKPKI